MLLTAELLAAAVLLVRPGDRAVRLVNLGDARTAALLDRVDAQLPDAVVAVEGFWGADWPAEIVVVGTDSAAEFTAQAHLDPTRDWTDIAAVAVADEVDAERRRATGQRIVLAPGAADMSDAALRIVLRHELFHLAARADTATDAPRWLTEGVADFVARPPAALPPDAAADPELPSDAALDRAGPQRSAGYDRAWWFARFVADTYSPGALRALYEKAAGHGRVDLPTAVAEALGTDMAGLQQQWSHWLGDNVVRR